MRRTNRLQIPGYPYHVISRGNNKSALFYKDADYRTFLRLMHSSQKKFPVKFYNYVLMSNHFHLMVEPTTDGILSKAMEAILKPYAQYFNKRYDHTGHVFERRYKNYIIQTEKYFFSCCRYINLNPVKANITSTPEKYPWSSFSSIAYGRNSLIKIDEHELYLSLGKTPQERQNAYRALIKHHNDDYAKKIQSGRMVIGDKHFKEHIKNFSNISPQ